MSVSIIADEQLHAALRELKQAVYNHEQWTEMLLGALICRLAPDERDMSAEAHRRCRFGQWFFGQENADLRRHPGFAQIELEHERMHRYATILLRTAGDGRPIPVEDYERFNSALKRMRLEIATITREMEEALHNLDPLTGTSTRTEMLTRLREQHVLVGRRVQACAIAMMDLDYFKTVNDTYGHVVGDSVLTAVARYVLANLRPYDLVFRYGGEEFLICLPNAELQVAYAIVERLRDGLGALEHGANGNEPFHVTVSFGLARLDSAVSVEESIERADKALYAAKAAGRNRVAIWEPTMGAAPDVPPAAAQ